MKPATLRNSFLADFVDGVVDETDRNAPASDVTDRNPVALACLNQAIDGSGIPRKDLAQQVGMSEANFSRVTSGQQGGSLALLDKLPREIRADYAQRVHDVWVEDLATQQRRAIARLAHVAIETLRICGVSAALPSAGKPLKVKL